MRFILAFLLVLLTSSCEDYLKWRRPELVSLTYEVNTCDSSYTWIDGITYFSDNNEATFMMSGLENIDTLFELDLVFYFKSDTMKIWKCNDYTWIDSIVYFENNNTATHMVTASDGCDSLVYLDLTIAPLEGVDVVESCGDYTWIDGSVYTQNNNTATHVLTTSSGCDSTVTLDLTIVPLQGVDVVESCGDYTWIDGNIYTQNNNTATHVLTTSSGCDSIVSLDLTIVPLQGVDVVQSCDDYTWIDGNIYTQNNNTATHLLATASGCDSLVSLDLTILYSTVVYDTVITCGPYTWINGITYTNDNYNAFVTDTAQNTCDSITQLHLTMNCECSTPPSFNCSITTTTSNNAANSWYSMVTTAGTTFQRGDSYTINMYSSQNYFFSPGSSVEMCCNETVVYVWSGSSMVNFSNNICTFQVPTLSNQTFPNTQIKNDNCFTFRVRKNSDVWVSTPFSIQ
jgi:hypothetical protein|tara:strand:- start:1206 stop:2573 length:1368 start_codon:yes stop_codon:yes gene_type:complete